MGIIDKKKRKVNQYDSAMASKMAITIAGKGGSTRREKENYRFSDGLKEREGRSFNSARRSRLIIHDGGPLLVGNWPAHICTVYARRERRVIQGLYSVI